jgi:hypothetical protein
MIIGNSNNISAPVRQIRGKVELYNGSTLAQTFNYTDALKSFSVERVGEDSKFFGFAVAQKVNVHILDPERELSITTAHTLKVYLNDICPYPTFYVTEVHRDENTNELSVTAYDALNAASERTVSELSVYSYTTREFATACAALIGAGLEVIGVADNETCFNTLYEEGANYDGTETIREAIVHVAEATQTVAYINSSDNLVYKRLDKSGDPVLTISKADYFTLQSGDNRRLAAICHATELGDNVSAALQVSGTTQYVRDNPLWDLREDVAELVDNALAAAGGLTINQLDCAWRGNYLLEPGDKIGVVTKDGATVTAYVLNDTVTYDGSLSEQTQWSYTDSGETESNPTTLGEVIKQTYARVDKANKRVDIAARQADANTEQLAALQLATDSISATVSRTDKNVSEQLDAVNEELSSLTKKVDLAITEEELSVKVNEQLESGVNKVTTTTGFTFDSTGLTVSKSDSEITTQITENGMIVNKNDEAVLTADAQGVKARDLHADTYLIIGTNSRFEDYGDGRTGCFWIGG